LWRWTAPHPAWQPSSAWPPGVGCVYAETRRAIVLVDPLVPAADEERFWTALDNDRRRYADRPVHILLTCRWHRRSADAIAKRYDADVTLVGSERPPQPSGSEPQGLEGVEFKVFNADKGWQEAVIFFRDHAAVVFGDVIEGDGAQGLRMPPEWWPPEDKRTARIKMELHRIFEWPFEIVIVSHGQPVLHDARATVARALEI
jgi:hypothetical protein